jgi:hypothetical protein
MPLMERLHYNWPRERHSRPPRAPRGLSGGTLALSLARREGKLTSVVLFPELPRSRAYLPIDSPYDRCLIVRFHPLTAAFRVKEVKGVAKVLLPPEVLFSKPETTYG